MLDEPIEKVAARNMFYDEAGKHVRTKKGISDDSGQDVKLFSKARYTSGRFSQSRIADLRVRGFWKK